MAKATKIPASDGMVSAIALSPLEHDGKSYKPDDPIELTEYWYDILSKLAPPVVAKVSGKVAAPAPEVDPIDNPPALLTEEA